MILINRHHPLKPFFSNWNLLGDLLVFQCLVEFLNLFPFPSYLYLFPDCFGGLHAIMISILFFSTSYCDYSPCKKIFNEVFLKDFRKIILGDITSPYDLVQNIIHFIPLHKIIHLNEHWLQCPESFAIVNYLNLSMINLPLQNQLIYFPINQYRNPLIPS